MADLERYKQQFDIDFREKEPQLRAGISAFLTRALERAEIYSTISEVNLEQLKIFRDARENGVLEIIEHAIGAKIPNLTDRNPYLLTFDSEECLTDTHGNIVRLVSGIFIPRAKINRGGFIERGINLVFFKAFKLNGILKEGEVDFIVGLGPDKKVWVGSGMPTSSETGVHYGKLDEEGIVAFADKFRLIFIETNSRTFAHRNVVFNSTAEPVILP